MEFISKISIRNITKGNKYVAKKIYDNFIVIECDKGIISKYLKRNFIEYRKNKFEKIKKMIKF